MFGSQRRAVTTGSRFINWITCRPAIVQARYLSNSEAKVEQSMNVPEAVAAQRWRVIRVASKVPRGVVFCGTGFTLVRRGKAFIITTAHVVDEARSKPGATGRLYVDFAPPVNSHPVISIESDAFNDVAVLGTGVISGSTHQETTGQARVGDIVYATGYDDEHCTSHTDVFTTSGRVVSTGLYVPEKGMLVTSGKAPGPSVPALILSGGGSTKGASGSPIFDGQGRIVGYLKGFVGLDGKSERGRIAFSIERAINLLEKSAR
jgi:hypothetical protein